jgi:ABC-type histidine transport system ATPase subunit
MCWQIYSTKIIARQLAESFRVIRMITRQRRVMRSIALRLCAEIYRDASYTLMYLLVEHYGTPKNSHTTPVPQRIQRYVRPLSLTTYVHAQ